MAQLPNKANTEGNDSKSGFEPLPEGTYTLAIIKSELKETKNKNGYFLFLTMKVQEGDMVGKVVFDRLNLVNPSAVAVEIANKQLNSLCEACGKQDVEDSEELHGIPFDAKIGVEPANENWPASNKILRYGGTSSGGGEKPIW